MATKKKSSILQTSPLAFEGNDPVPRTADGIAVRIRAGRERKGVSLAELHRLSGLSKTALHDYESGRTKPGAKELKVLCEILHVTPNWLIFGTEEPLKERSGIRELVKMRGTPMAMMTLIMTAPIIAAVLDEDQFESLLILASSMLEARDKEAYRAVSIMVEMLAKEYGTGTFEEVGAHASRHTSRRI